MTDLYQEIGAIVSLVDPDTADVGTIDFGDRSIRANQYGGILFVMSCGDVVATGSAIVNILYSPTGVASDAVELAGATDATVTFDSDNPNSVLTVFVDFHDKAVTEIGTFGVQVVVADAAVELGVLAIPSGGNIRVPIAQTTAMVVT